MGGTGCWGPSLGDSASRAGRVHRGTEQRRQALPQLDCLTSDLSHQAVQWPGSRGDERARVRITCAPNVSSANYLTSGNLFNGPELHFLPL